MLYIRLSGEFKTELAFQTIISNPIRSPSIFRPSAIRSLSVTDLLSLRSTSPMSLARSKKPTLKKELTGRKCMLHGLDAPDINIRKAEKVGMCLTFGMSVVALHAIGSIVFLFGHCMGGIRRIIVQYRSQSKGLYIYERIMCSFYVVQYIIILQFYWLLS